MPKMMTNESDEEGQESEKEDNAEAMVNKKKTVSEMGEDESLN